MDADGQHPAGSIAEFMAASTRRPEALVLGRPVFPPNIPAERLHCRKLSVGIVRFELMGRAIDDPLFGFRVYPIAPLLEMLGPRRGGRRYDFDTEAAVRLVWAGVPPLNIAAPVKYFSRAEGGVSHFHYFRDNVTLVWMHAKLVTEFLLLRWPALRRHRRRWQAVGVLFIACLLFPVALRAATADAIIDEEHRLAPAAPGWSDLVEAYANHPDTTARFKELRFFPFKKGAVLLQGEVHVSSSRGLSLHYIKPEDRTVILDDDGVLIRVDKNSKTVPADPRAAAANEALRNVLRMDLAALEKDFELYGQRDGDTWSLALVARTPELRRSVGSIQVNGESTTIRRIEIRRTAKTAIEILIEPPSSRAAFTEEELERFFR
jgi:hypothetical protein